MAIQRQPLSGTDRSNGLSNITMFIGAQNDLWERQFIPDTDKFGLG